MTLQVERILLRGGYLARENSPVLEETDILLENGVISRVAPGLIVNPDMIVEDCSGCVFLPPMADLHVHAREPGQEKKETVATAAAAALNGGVTAMVLMPNTVPAVDNAGVVRSVLDAGAKTPVDVHTSGAITKDREGKELAAIAAMRDAGVRMLTDDGFPVSNPQVLRLAMEYARDFDLLMASHCETMELSKGGSMNEGTKSYQLGLRGIPPESEEMCIDKDARLARMTGARLHIQHVTTAEGMRTIRRHRDKGARITCEVAPHHMLFIDEDIGDYDTNYKMNPPLRTPADREALTQGLIDGMFDIIATDHAPHTDFEKRQDFSSAPFGITGLETAVVSLYHHFIRKSVFGWDLLIKRYSAEPRRLMDWEVLAVEEGRAADLVVFDTRATTVFDREFMRSKSVNTPFFNQELCGRIKGVWKSGQRLIWR